MFSKVPLKYCSNLRRMKMFILRQNRKWLEGENEMSKNDSKQYIDVLPWNELTYKLELTTPTIITTIPEPNKKRTRFSRNRCPYVACMLQIVAHIQVCVWCSVIFMIFPQLKPFHFIFFHTNFCFLSMLFCVGQTSTIWRVLPLPCVVQNEREIKNFISLSEFKHV